MKTKKITVIAASLSMGAVFALSGCGDETVENYEIPYTYGSAEDILGNQGGKGEQQQNQGQQGQSQGNNSGVYVNTGEDITGDELMVEEEQLPQSLIDALAHMGNEERLAYDLYYNLYSFHSNENGVEIQQLQNIAEKSEVKHIEMVQSMVRKYNIDGRDSSETSVGMLDSAGLSNTITKENMPSGQYAVKEIQELYDTLFDKGKGSTLDALAVGCMVEVVDVSDLSLYIGTATDEGYTDIIDTFEKMRNASYNHYWSFDGAMKDLGYEDGCCGVGIEYCKSEEEFPKNK